MEMWRNIWKNIYFNNIRFRPKRSKGNVETIYYFILREKIVRKYVKREKRHLGNRKTFILKIFKAKKNVAI